MEEEVGLKVTRLRRRLSVETEDVKSPSTQSTPTKKRGRLAAKPQLELIDENASVIKDPKTTKKSISCDAKPEEKSVTPSRRSTRIRSNTSFSSETPLEAEDKGTPSRRSTRIKSNTSIVAEASQHVDSPRAKRAARRTSQAGSDNDAPITPGRSTRRTRKNSTSSIDKQAELNPNKLGTQIKEMIIEEAESNMKNLISLDTPAIDTNETTTTRKSPRFVEKTSKRSSTDHKYLPESVKESNNEKFDSDTSFLKSPKSNKNSQEINLSDSSSTLIQNLDDEPKRHAYLNKTTSAIEKAQLKLKRRRTKSWTTMTVNPSNDNNFLSDTEATKKKIKMKSNTSNGFSSYENVLITSNRSNSKTEVQYDMGDMSSTSPSISDKKKKKHIDKSILDNETKVPIVNTSAELDKSVTNDKDLLQQKEDPNSTEKLFLEAPSGTVRSLIYIEDSDSNTATADKDNVLQNIESEDQCVPVVDHKLEEQMSKDEKNNLSYEPMEIDETISENVSLSVFEDKNTLAINDTSLRKGKSLNTQNTSIADNIIINANNKSQRKSTILDLENDNKNTPNKSKQKDLPSCNDPADIHAEELDNDTDDISIRNINNSSNKSDRMSSINNFGTSDQDNNSLKCRDASMNKSANILKRKSKDDSSNDEDKNKSNRKSSVSCIDTEDNSTGKFKSNDEDTDVNDVHMDTGIIEVHNQGHRSSNIPESNSIVEIANKRNRSIRKSSNSNVDNDENIGLSKNNFKKKSRSSKISSNDNEDNDGTMEEMSIDSKSMTNTLNVSDVNVNNSVDKSDVIYKSESVMNDKTNKTKKKSLVPDADHVKYTRNSSFGMATDNEEVDSGFNKSNNYGDIRNLSSNQSKQKSSNTCNDNINNNLSKSTKESTVSDLVDCVMDISTDKSKGKYSISKIDVEDSVDSVLNKSCNKSKRKSSISETETRIFGNSSNESKSTLILSQIKGVSETGVSKELNELNESKDSNEQFSKSINMPISFKDKESNKKNLSLTYSTSTPLQQKNLKKLDMQMNSSIITTNNISKMDNNHSLGRSKKETANLSRNHASEPSTDEDVESSEEDNEESSEEESRVKSKVIENEADEASENYESGDSRDEDSREYEEQHEIIERGETLDSEDESFSDDSEYERGSFVVDSDEEDDQLLSGSGDDLSMSADELNMSAKSKRKFNERKIKEQKTASREMFEARHKLDKSNNKVNSNKSTLTKKVNRQRLVSSESDSEVKVSVKPKKNKRARIDSSQEITITQSDPGVTEFKQKKKSSRKLTNSVCEENGANEIEISISNTNETAKEDPLSLCNIVKEEPKTPQKDFNMSTVSITNLEIEEVNIQNNISIMKSNQTTDPLQTTEAGNLAMDDVNGESLSENEEIVQNYESVLNDLNKKSKKVKTVDMSLNLHKKTKQKDKEPIVDELNLTQTKKFGKKKQNSTLKSDFKQVDKDKHLNNNIIDNINKSLNIQEEGSSDSIDMKLLFNDDSTDSEIKTSAQREDKAIAEELIPLKRTEGQTNILLKTNSVSEKTKECVLNVSKSKKVKQRSSLPVETVEDDQDDENLNFFIDTTGTHIDVNKSVDTSKSTSAKKNKRKNKVSVTNIENSKSDDELNDYPLEDSYQSDKNIDKSKQRDLNTSHIRENKNFNLHNTPVSAKKNKKSLDKSPIIKQTEEEEFQAVITERDTSKSRKRKAPANQSIEEMTEKDDTKVLDEQKVLNESLVKKSQKKKRKISHTTDIVYTEEKVPGASFEKQGQEGLADSKHKKKTAPEQKPLHNDDFTKKSKKRKERDDDSGEKLAKVIKQNSMDKVHIPRIPINVLKQLDDYPRKYESKNEIISTTAFKVEETKKRKNKPSNYLEQSVYLNDSTEEQTKNKTVKAPKVLPFIPTASTSDYGFTTNFKVNVIPQETQFVAQSSDMCNFKKDYLQKNRIKKLGTFEKYKRHRTLKISKF